MLGTLLAVCLLQQIFVLERVRILRAQAHVGLQNAMPMGKVNRLHCIPLLKARCESRQVVVVKRRETLLVYQSLLDSGRRDSGGLMRDRGVQRVELVLHKELPVGVLDNAVTNRHDLDLAHRRAIAHIVEGYARFAEKLSQRRPFVNQAREDKAAIAVDAGGTFYVAVGIARRHACVLITFGQGNRTNLTVKVKTPGMV